MSSGKADASAQYAIPGVSPQPLPSVPIVVKDGAFDQWVDARMSKTYFATPGGVAGAMIAVVKDGAPVALRAYGIADASTGRKVDPATTLFRIGSTSKLATATAAMQLVEQGKLDLDMDVNARLGLGVGKFTLRNLLTHTAGFEENQFGYMIKADPRRNTLLAETVARHLPAQVREAATDFDHDRFSSYSSMGIVLIGRLIEIASGDSFDDYVAKNVFERLGMARSTFAEPLPAGLEPDRAFGHMPDGKGGFLPQDREWWHSVAPAGGMHTTAGDMARYMLAHLEPGRGGLFSDDTAQRMHGRSLTQHPRVNGSALGFYEMHLNGRRLLAHRGKTLCFSSYLAIMPEERFGVFIALNSPAPWQLAHSIVQGLLDQHFPAAVQVPAPPAFDGSAWKHTGSYVSNSHSYEKNEKFMRFLFAAKYENVVTALGEHTLQCTTTSEPDTLDEVEPGVFKVRGRQDQVAFVHGARGTHMLGPNPFAASSRLAKYETAALHDKLFKLAQYGLYAAIAWVVLGPGLGGAPFWPMLLPAVAAVLYRLGFETLKKELADVARIMYGPHRALDNALTQVQIAAAITLVVALCTLAAWSLGWWTLLARLVYTSIAVVQCTFLWQLHYWRLLGHRHA